jgi:hypothetical protein
MTDQWTDKDIAARFEQALYTLKRLPERRVGGYHKLWPPIVYDRLEIMQQEKKRFRLGPPLPRDIDRMEETFTWIGWLEVDERELVWLRAVRMPWRVICTRIGASKTVARTRWTAALMKIARRKNNDPLIKKKEKRKQN